MGKIMNSQIEHLKEHREDILEAIAEGTHVRTLFERYQCGRRAFYKWLNSDPELMAEYRQAQEAAGHMYAYRAVETAQEATPENVNVARLQVNTDQWMAAKLNQQYDTRQKEVAVTLRIEDMHAEMARIVGDQAEAALLEAIAEEDERGEIVYGVPDEGDEDVDGV